MKAYLSRSLIFAGVLGLLVPQAFAAESRFIEDLPEMTQDAEREGAMIWVKPGVDRAAYKMVMIEPITIFISPDSKYQGLSVDDLQALAHHFTETLTTTLEPEVPIVNQAGPGVLYLRAALTNVNVAKKKKGLLGYTPVGLVAGAVKSVTVGPSLSLKNAVLEVEMFDSVSGERVGVLIDKAPKMPKAEAAAGGEMDEGETGEQAATEPKQELSWDSINETFAFYASRFKDRMLAARQQK